MKAYYLNRHVKLFHGDAVRTLNELPEESIDLIFADPPYNLSNDGFTCLAGKRVSVNKGKWDKSAGVEEDFNFHSNWIQACKRVLKPNGSLWVSGTYHSIYMCGFALQKQGWHLINDICWLKPNAAPNLSCRMFTASHETLLWARKNKSAKHYFNYALVKTKDWNGDSLKKPNKQMRSVWSITSPKSQEKIYGKHSTQKPEALLERIILACSQENDIILDPFCGSATTGVAALKNNREFVGIDAEKQYLDNIAIPRLKEEACMKRTDAVMQLRKLEGKELHELAEQYGVSKDHNGRVNKGWTGHLFERYLGLPINSKQEPDCGSWELKSIPLKYKKNGELTFKETMAITMIDPVNVCQKEFEDSHLLAKLKKAIVIARIVGVDDLTYIHSITEFDLSGEMYGKVKADYDLVRSILQNNPSKGVEALSGSMGVYIQPRTKGKGHGSISRAFYARPKFLAQFIKI